MYRIQDQQNKNSHPRITSTLFGANHFTTDQSFLEASQNLTRNIQRPGVSGLPHPEGEVTENDFDISDDANTSYDLTTDSGQQDATTPLIQFTSVSQDSADFSAGATLDLHTTANAVVLPDNLNWTAPAGSTPSMPVVLNQDASHYFGTVQELSNGGDGGLDENATSVLFGATGNAVDAAFFDSFAMSFYAGLSALEEKTSVYDTAPNVIQSAANSAAYVVENQQPLNDPTEITDAHFGVNLLTTQDVELLDANDDMLSDLIDLGVSTVRFPGGSVTENTFDMDHPNLEVAPSSAPDAGSPLIPLEQMFATMAQSPDPIAVSLVIPTRDAFTTSAAEAALVAPDADQSYGSRDALDPSYIGSPWEGEIPLDADGNPVLMGPDVEVDGVLGYVSYSLKLAEAYGDEVTTLEIGNEFWGAGEMTASEYGFVAAQTALAIDEMLNSPEYADFDVDVVVQTTSSASQLYSPKDDVTAYVAEIDGELTLLSMEKIDKPSDKGGFDGVIDPSWTEVVIPGQGSAKNQGDAIIAQFNALEGAGDAIDGVVQHYYEGSGLDQVTDQGIYKGPDHSSAFSFQQFNTFQDDLIRSNPEDLTYNITEWNARNNDYLGLQQASMQIEVFYELVANGVDVAQAWPLTFDIQGRSLLDVNDPLSGLSISGEMFKMMSESLVGLSPIFDFQVTTGQGADTTWLLDAHGFGSEDRTVVFVSERTGQAQIDVTFDLGNYLVANQTYFYTGTELWDGGSGGDDPNAEPVLSFIDGVMITGTMVSFDINSWANLRLELTAVGEGDDNVLAREGNDTIETFAGNDTVHAGNGDDSVSGGDGNDLIYGDDGMDFLEGMAGADVLEGNEGRDSLLGGGGADTLRGGNGNDTINGDNGNDKIRGGNGNDSLDGGAGADTLTGGAGSDTFIFAKGTQSDTVTDFTQGEDVIDLTDWDIWDMSQLGVAQSGTTTTIVIDSQNSIELQNFTATDLTNADFVLSDAPSLGTALDDNLVGTAAADVFDAGDGSDVVNGKGGADIINGGAGQDKLSGGAGRDTIDGGVGKDNIQGGGGNDDLIGADGNDLIEGGAGADNITGGAANDRLYGDAGNDTVIGDAGNDKLWGGDNNDLLDGVAGKDTMDGGAGADTLFGGDGNDQLYGKAGDDKLWAETGNDTLQGGDGNDTMGGADGRDSLSGEAGNDLIYGGEGSDTISGGDGQDTVHAGGGDDVINGDAGNDILWGDAGSDLFIFNAGDESDRITDFTDNVDTLQLDSTLWGDAPLDAGQVIAAYANVVDNDVVFDFGNGDVITLVGLGVVGTAALVDDILV